MRRSSNSSSRIHATCEACKKIVRNFLLSVAVALSVGIGGSNLAVAQSTSSVEVPKPVAKLVEGFNAAEPEAMGASLSQDCQVRYVNKDGSSTVGSNDRATLVRQMRGYFQQIQQPRSELSDISIVGRFVTAKEAVSWKVRGKMQQQFSLVVFELGPDGKSIQRVWYYPHQQ